MDYIFHVGDEDLRKLVRILAEASAARGVRMGAITATMILTQVLDEAEKAGVFTPIETEGALRDYSFDGDKAELLRLVEILENACTVHDISLGTIQSTIVLIQVLDEAQKAGIFTPITPGVKND